MNGGGRRVIILTVKEVISLMVQVCVLGECVTERALGEDVAVKVCLHTA